jgi:CRISPR-associated protein Cmr3
MNIWYQLTPADTLFFRGSEPLEAGQLSRDALFPPPVSVIQGAVRTAVLKQRGISFDDYKEGRCPRELTNLFGESGKPAPFAVTAILLAKDGATYAPCPASWFVESGLRQNVDRPLDTDCKILRAAPLVDVAAKLRLHSSSGLGLPMVLPDTEAEPLAGNWLRLECLFTAAATIGEGDLLSLTDLCDIEPRTGIAIDEKRKVRQGKLYSAGHIRLRDGVSFIIGIDRDPGLSNGGLLSLGGEKRVCGYVRSKPPSMPVGSSSLYLALAPIKLTTEVQPFVFAAAKPITIAGWDLHTGFHKPTTTWLPAGSVFTRNIDNYCIPLAQ